jgi:hypothetical protein
MKRRLVSVVAVFALVMGLAPASALAAEDAFTALEPGETVTFAQTVPINIVFIGYQPNKINTRAVLNELPDAYEPVVRVPQFYGLPGRDVGLRFNFDYDVTFTGDSFENRFFSYLRQIGTRGGLTDYQTQYNQQDSNVLNVRGPVLYIDGPSVEGWLARNLNVPSRGYTIAFINWHGRSDFRFHVYTKTDEPDPDTGHNFGELDTRQMIAWGGTHSRLWFHDLSAGPEWNTDNWNVDQPDLDGDGTEEYRMPPSWEYRAGGYRAASALSSDLGLVTRFVGINLLFTTSPLYDPMVAAPGPGGDRVLHMNMFEDDPASSGTDWINPGLAEDLLSAFQPYYDWRTRLVDRDPIDAGARRAFRIFAGVRDIEDCWVPFGDPFAELFCYFDANLGRYVPAYGRNDYVTEIFNFNSTEARLNDQFGLLGFADDNWTDGTQTYVFTFGAEAYRDIGYGFTSTVVHEAGHHFGLSHPHDGYDSELGLDYGPGGEFYYAWVGDESDTVMQYLGVSNGFGEFDQDNMYRWEMAGYLNRANGLLDDILAHPRANSVSNKLARAEQFARTSISSFRNWRYLASAANARMAYEEIARAAAQLGIEDTAAAALRVGISNAALPLKGDPIRGPGN